MYMHVSASAEATGLDAAMRAAPPARSHLHSSSLCFLSLSLRCLISILHPSPFFLSPSAASSPFFIPLLSFSLRPLPSSRLFACLILSSSCQVCLIVCFDLDCMLRSPLPLLPSLRPAFYARVGHLRP
eukprot:GHVU01211523.1.p1 GENE.GHVU01211523.1~~GHVU01211523.1.p1  ORF type:complete len:128 (-),score=3.23 GHVU01211523.1:1509-1892(-)